MKNIMAAFGLGFMALAGNSQGNELTEVVAVEAQPLLAQTKRLEQAMQYSGQPFGAETLALLEKARSAKGDAEVAKFVQAALDPLCLFGVTINPESRVKVASGPVAPELAQHGWRQFLVKVANEAGVTAPLKSASPQAGRLHGAKEEKIRDLWLEMKMYDGRPLQPKLSGLALEYRVIQLYSRDAGKRAAEIAFDIGQGTQDIGFRNDVLVTFTNLAAQKVVLGVKDEDGEPTMAAFEIRDRFGRVYPSQAKRLAPDFAFHPQVYRYDGESVELPKGVYSVDVSRGPEYYPVKGKKLVVGESGTTFSVKLERWIDPSDFGWWSGDHHIHAAGCAHYKDPSEGVHAPDMFRHCLGEDLKVGANLTWGPCFDYQKQFFTGEVDKVSRYPYLLRYDVEVSGFGSHRSGHLCLLRLKNQIPEGGDSKDHWPTLCLNTLKWAKTQGAVTGPAHSGWGINVPGDELPNYNIPPYNGIGANEYIVDVTHKVPGSDGKLVPAVDFLSMVDTPYVWELNMWYHTLNCGFRTRVSGETDFPCIYGERVGLGRAYVKLPGKLNYDGWCLGIQKGAAYVGDGRSHLIGFQVGEASLEGIPELKLGKPGKVKVSAKVAAYLPEDADARLGSLPYTTKPYWHLERARKDGRMVEVELVVNGEAVRSKKVLADGQLQEVTFDLPLRKSSWVAMRILPSSHTNPVFVEVGGKPIRPNRRSVEWCIAGVKKCKQEKRKFIAESELEDFEEAYAHAMEVYGRILEESKD